MRVSRSREELKDALGRGVMCFPVTDFDHSGGFAAKPFSDRLDWLVGYKPNVVVATGGAGEFFSLSADEYSQVVAASVSVASERLPVLGAAGFSTTSAIDYAVEAGRLGADGILLLPPYLTESPQEGLVAHIEAVCKSTSLGVIVYNRANCRLAAESVVRLAEKNPNFVALKDGHGDIEDLQQIQAELGDRLVLINGMPTAEVFARSYFGMDIRCYSSAILNFLPKSAMAFFDAVDRGDQAAISTFMTEFLIPYGKIRRRRAGYAVSIVKAGVTLAGRTAGVVRPPLDSLTIEETAMLAELIERAGPQD